MKSLHLLIVEDNEEVAEMLVVFFNARGLEVTIAPDGEAALAHVREGLPSLILLDVGLPDIDGYELFKKFRQGVRTRYIPVIFLTRRSRKADRIAGLQLGADDFITKPFDLEELFLRVQNAALRAERENLTHPHTGLPIGQITREALAEATGRANRQVLQFGLLNTSEFRDLYGVLAGADLLRYTALLLNRVLNSAGSPDDFLGQLGDETFVIITSAEHAETIRKHVVDRFNNDAVQHYALGERQGDRVRVKDIAGREVVLPLISLVAQPVR